MFEIGEHEVGGSLLLLLLLLRLSERIECNYQMFVTYVCGGYKYGKTNNWLLAESHRMPEMRWGEIWTATTTTTNIHVYVQNFSFIKLHKGSSARVYYLLVQWVSVVFTYTYTSKSTMTKTEITHAHTRTQCIRVIALSLLFVTSVRSPLMVVIVAKTLTFPVTHTQSRINERHSHGCLPRAVKLR